MKKILAFFAKYKHPAGIPFAVKYSYNPTETLRLWLMRVWSYLHYSYLMLSKKVEPYLIRWNISWQKLTISAFILMVVSCKSLQFQFNAQGTKWGTDRSNPYTNEFAPADLSILKNDANIKYIREYKHIAIDEMKRLGIPASITIAQGIIESRAGASRLARENKNHFGIKCFSKTCKKGHCSNFHDDHHKDFFRKFQSVEESYKAHSALLSSPYYKSLHTLGKDYKAWAKGLRDLGYATAKNYDRALISVIDKYNLYELDN